MKRAFCSAAAASSPRQRRSQHLATMRIFDPDRTGIVAASSELLHRHGCTIVQSEHYTDRENEMFFQRILFEHSKTPRSIIDVVQPTGTHDKSPQDTVNFETQLRESEMSGEFMNLLASESGVLKGDLDWMNKPKRVAIMVSRFDHCLWELLLRHRASELSHYQNTIAANNNSDNTKVRIEIPLVISNHDNCRSIVEDTFGIPFVYMPITAENKEEQELKEIELLLQYKVDVVVLARYMQVLSPRVLDAFPNSIINIHHSFLPAFAGGKAYRQAHERGVKLIGATAHYTTSDLDEGPIIEQDVIPVSQRDTCADFVRKGQMLERSVLVRAVQAHLDNRVIVHNNKCLVFG